MRALTMLLSLTLAGNFACASGGGAPREGKQPPVSSRPAPSADPDDPTAGLPEDDVDVGDPQQQSGPTMGDRAKAATEGLLIGTIVGAQAGPFGAAVGGLASMIYGAVTGDAPLGGGGRGDGAPGTERGR